MLPALALVGLTKASVPDLGPGPRIDVVVPGVLALAVISSAFTGQAIQTGFDRRYGVLRMLGTTPLGRGGLLAGKAVGVLAVLAVQVVVLSGARARARLVAAVARACRRPCWSGWPAPPRSSRWRCSSPGRCGPRRCWPSPTWSGCCSSPAAPCWCPPRRCPPGVEHAGPVAAVRRARRGAAGRPAGRRRWTSAALLVLVAWAVARRPRGPQAVPMELTPGLLVGSRRHGVAGCSSCWSPTGAGPGGGACRCCGRPGSPWSPRPRSAGSAAVWPGGSPRPGWSSGAPPSPPAGGPACSSTRRRAGGRGRHDPAAEPGPPSALAGSTWRYSAAAGRRRGRRRPGAGRPRPATYPGRRERRHHPHAAATRSGTSQAASPVAGCTPVLVANLVVQIGIVVTGGLVRLTGSGLGCPTWPRVRPRLVHPGGAPAAGHPQVHRVRQPHAHLGGRASSPWPRWSCVLLEVRRNGTAPPAASRWPPCRWSGSSSRRCSAASPC